MDDILSIDHHAPIKEFSKFISSTNLAIDWVRKNGILDKDYSVILNHTDCDSVLSSFVIRGILLPEGRIGQAAIIADHTGEENEIADLLLALQFERDLAFSARNLQLLLDKKTLESHAQKLLEERSIERRKASEVVEDGKFKKLGGLSYVQLDKKIESSFFLALISDAQIILSLSPHEKNSKYWESKIRLGMAAPEGLTLDKLEINDFDLNFGYRWNAGGNRRGGGVALTIEEYAMLLNEKLQKFLKSKKG